MFRKHDVELLNGLQGVGAGVHLGRIARVVVDDHVNPMKLRETVTMIRSNSLLSVLIIRTTAVALSYRYSM